MPVDINDLEPEQRRDFRRANGAPMVSDPNNPGKTLRYSRPSEWGKELDEQSALVNWRINTAMKGVAHSRGLAAKVVAAGDDKSAFKDLRNEAIQAGRGNEASDIGTALHAMSERYDNPLDEWEAPEPFASRLAQYADVIQIAGLLPVAVECRVVNDQMRCAGTADRIYRVERDLRAPNGSIIHAGETIIGDLKTGRTLEYSIAGYTIQMALYADGVFYDVNTDERGEPVGVNERWGLIVHLPADSPVCHLVWCDLEAGREGARMVRDVRAWRRRKDLTGTFTFPDEVEEQVIDQLEAAFGTVTPVQREQDLSPQEWVDMMSPWCQQRIQRIATNEAAKDLLIRMWPFGLPTIKQGGHTPEQMTRVLDMLDDVEAAFGMGFPEGDPRAPMRLGLHRDEMHRGNTQPTQ